MDTVLTIGIQNAKLAGFLKRMGYRLLMLNSDEGLEPLVGETLIDLVLIDSTGDGDGLEFCRFFRAQSSTRDVPIIYIGTQGSESDALKGEMYKNIEYVNAPYSVGVLVSKIATGLRLRKMAGKDQDTATLGEVNARLRDLNEHFIKELKEAREIQEGLTPSRLPEDRRFDIAVSYQPLEEVGGDWYFVEQCDEGISVQIADVTGHGLSAAFIGSMTKLAKTAAAVSDPAQLLTKMNKLMAPSLPDGRFVTCFSYLYSPESGELKYARGGHPPALVLRRESGEVEQLKGEGFAIGFFEEGTYEPGFSRLDPGDILLVYTDGFSEAQNRSNTNYGYERMSNLLRNSSPKQSAEELLIKLMKDFTKFLDGRLLKDDITAILLRRVS